jgi:hypothetical protein
MYDYPINVFWKANILSIPTLQEFSDTTEIK